MARFLAMYRIQASDKGSAGEEARRLARRHGLEFVRVQGEADFEIAEEERSASRRGRRRESLEEEETP